MIPSSVRATRLMPMQPSPVGRVAWAMLVVAALAFKSFIPLLAAVAAQMQGKQVADICSIYGVRLGGGHTHVHGGSHAMAHTAGMAMSATQGESSPKDGPADHASHVQDHCALTGLAVCAVLALALFTFADWDAREPTHAFLADAPELSRDASARWLTSRLHAPPLA